MTKEDGVWAIVMFDLPTHTEQQRHAANQFRKLLKANGFSMFQYSVYVRYAITVAAHQRQHQAIKHGLPQDGHVVILLLSDHAWARAQRFTGKRPEPPPDEPGQLTIF